MMHDVKCWSNLVRLGFLIRADCRGSFESQSLSEGKTQNNVEHVKQNRLFSVFGNISYCTL